MFPGPAFMSSTLLLPPKKKIKGSSWVYKADGTHKIIKSINIIVPKMSQKGLVFLSFGVMHYNVFFSTYNPSYQDMSIIA